MNKLVDYDDTDSSESEDINYNNDENKLEG